MAVTAPSLISSAVVWSSPSPSRATKPGRPLMKVKGLWWKLFRRHGSELARVHVHDTVEPEDRPPGSGPLAAAIHMKADVRCQHSGERGPCLRRDRLAGISFAAPL